MQFPVVFVWGRIDFLYFIFKFNIPQFLKVFFLEPYRSVPVKSYYIPKILTPCLGNLSKSPPKTITMSLGIP